MKNFLIRLIEGPKPGIKQTLTEFAWALERDIRSLD